MERQGSSCLVPAFHCVAACTHDPMTAGHWPHTTHTFKRRNHSSHASCVRHLCPCACSVRLSSVSRQCPPPALPRELSPYRVVQRHSIFIIQAVLGVRARLYIGRCTQRPLHCLATLLLSSAQRPPQSVICSFTTIRQRLGQAKASGEAGALHVFM